MKYLNPAFNLEIEDFRFTIFFLVESTLSADLSKLMIILLLLGVGFAEKQDRGSTLF
jgi:hypothetical protein